YTIKGVIETILDIFGIDAEYIRSGEPYLHGGRSADILSNGIKIGSFGEVHPSVAKHYGIKEKRIYTAEIYSDYILKNAVLIRPFRAVSKYPSVVRDLALLLDEAVEAASVVKSIKKYANDTLEKINVFDVFRGSQIPDGKKSLALSLEFQSYDRTLNDTEIKTAIDAILEGVKTELGGELRL
ncbi:MAG: phenylalanine--tRNA ligase subunit beta, partial [Clostridiales bacterium]|nr:phenylalanine--tRNA ligase subunit beta [Clostridiales bacterium]